MQFRQFLGQRKAQAGTLMALAQLAFHLAKRLQHLGNVFRRGEDVAIAVSDNGIGIRAEDIPKVLEPFGQVESEMSHKHPGTGLGLPLTKELAELHGGSLTMESNIDVGTTVTIILPPDPKAVAA